jgi:hypothetical protein
MYFLDYKTLASDELCLCNAINTAFLPDKYTYNFFSGAFQRHYSLGKE